MTVTTQLVVRPFSDSAVMVAVPWLSSLILPASASITEATLSLSDDHTIVSFAQSYGSYETANRIVTPT